MLCTPTILLRCQKYETDYFQLRMLFTQTEYRNLLLSRTLGEFSSVIGK
ncbi:MAG: hypothetical protein HUJ26_20735 [Planctomycetaceae bacterium]|nr:hypothetical protein [Planctomycetaceae bacterium]